MSKTKRIIIVGCGRLGARLANHLSAANHNVVIIDRRQAMFDKLTFDFSGFTVVGDATELQVLADAGLARSDCLFAVTSQDNTNLMVAQVGREWFNVPCVVARIFDPEREAIYRSFGVETISPTRLSSDEFIAHVNEKHAEAVEGEA